MFLLVSCGVRSVFSHSLDTLSNSLNAELATLSLELAEFIGTSLPKLFHRVNENSGIIAIIWQDGGVKGSHHIVILVNQIVAMEHVYTRERLPDISNQL